TNDDATISPQISKIEMRYFMADAWSSIEGEPIQCDPSKGRVDFGYTLGRAPLQVHIIYNGGYFFETLEPTDGGYPSAAPAGSTALPAGILGAFLLQCKEIVNKMDILGAGI